MDGYRKMMAGLRRYQAPSGLWRQLIDNDQSWVETSGTGMFTYAMIIGVQHGWLDAKEYGDCARKGWIGLCGYVDADGNGPRNLRRHEPEPGPGILFETVRGPSATCTSGARVVVRLGTGAK